MTNVCRFVNYASETVKVQGGQELKRPDLNKFGKSYTIASLVSDSSAVNYFEELLSDWCAQTEKLVMVSVTHIQIHVIVYTVTHYICTAK